MSEILSSATDLKTIVIDGAPLSLFEVTRTSAEHCRFELSEDPEILSRLRRAEEIISVAVNEGQNIYGVTTGFGSLADVVVPPAFAARSQNNLLSFLATGAGEPIDARHVRSAMLLRANMLMRGQSGIRLEIIDRFVRFLQAGATPVVRELGSIGASGDLVPLATIARAITGQTDYCQVELDDETIDGRTALDRLGLEPIELKPKEGLAIVNGTSFSAAVAANACGEVRNLLGLTLVTNAMILRALNVQSAPFDAFVHECKPHPGQMWVAQRMRELLFQPPNHHYTNGHVQDRYSLRCFPQYWGPSVEAFARICDTVEIEMNAVSDNPLIDTIECRIVQNGNFLGQYIAQAMDDLRTHIGMIAKHLDVQIAQMVSPEFSLGLPASLRGNESLSYNMGLKGLQISANSIMPMLTWYGNPLTSHYPTHAEQFNQNINGLSWGSAQLAWKSVQLFQSYTSVALIFAVQALDLRARTNLGHYDGRKLLSPAMQSLYECVYDTLGLSPGGKKPLVYDDADQWLEAWLAQLTDNIREEGSLVMSVQHAVDAFDDFRLPRHANDFNTTDDRGCRP
ncbi:MAG: histidine ammonia-lyase [Planctomyces sp.]|nr:histidine ammonia-lyase [Planctomyces sp.]